MCAEYIFTSESVTEGHPDKLCDQISDALVGHYLRQDPMSRIIAECAVSTGILFVSVKASSKATVDVPHTAREVILDVGYHRGSFNGLNCTVMTNQSQIMTNHVHANEQMMDEAELDQVVAQDNVTTFGFACSHTPILMPLPIWLSHRVVRQLDTARKTSLDYLAPDGSCQVGVVFREQKPYRIDSITLVTSQWQKSYPSLAMLRHDVMKDVIRPVFEQEMIGLNGDTRINVNPEGLVLEGGPALHAGLTGRKNGIDTYGGYSRQSGAALSGKDPTRIDRVGAYAARYAAKNVVAAKLASQCEVQLSYSIGAAAPVSVRVETFGTGQMPDDELTNRVRSVFDFRLGNIIRRFGLRDLARACDGQFYRRLSIYGHVGRADIELPWEKTDLVDTLS